MPNQAGIYGIVGVASSNNVPGSRWNAVSWTDKVGNLWLFGGKKWYRDTSNTEINNYYNDLWKFDIITNHWTWISGANFPNQLGNYGTKEIPSLENIPGSREKSVTWTDSNGNLWLFGGFGFSSSGAAYYLNDLWKFDTTSKQWSWIGGNNLPNQPPYGSYGTIRLASPNNVPGSRALATSWTDSNGYLWLFGGFGSGSPYKNGGRLNDLWKFNTSTNQWTWLGGSDQGDQTGVYGTMGIPSSINVPRGRSSAVGLVDKIGNFWLFGGEVNYSSGRETINDLWKFTPK